jgi:hypothetical protein
MNKNFSNKTFSKNYLIAFIFIYQNLFVYQNLFAMGEMSEIK